MCYWAGDGWPEQEKLDPVGMARLKRNVESLKRSMGLMPPQTWVERLSEIVNRDKKGI